MSRNPIEDLYETNKDIVAFIITIFLGRNQLFQWYTNRFEAYPVLHTKFNIIGLTILTKTTTDPLGEEIALQNLEVQINPIYEGLPLNINEFGQYNLDENTLPVPPPESN